MVGWHNWLDGHEWVWASSGIWWWIGKPGVAAVHGVAKSQTRLTELNWCFQGMTWGNVQVRTKWKNRKLNLKQHDLNCTELDMYTGRIQIGDSVYSEKKLSVLVHIFYSKHLLRKSVSKNLKRLSSNAVSTQNFSIDFLISTQIIPCLLIEAWEESVVTSTLFLFHPAYPPQLHSPSPLPSPGAKSEESSSPGRAHAEQKEVHSPSWKTPKMLCPEF